MQEYIHAHNITIKHYYRKNDPHMTMDYYSWRRVSDSIIFQIWPIWSALLKTLINPCEKSRAS